MYYGLCPIHTRTPKLIVRNFMIFFLSFFIGFHARDWSLAGMKSSHILSSSFFPPSWIYLKPVENLWNRTNLNLNKMNMKRWNDSIILVCVCVYIVFCLARSQDGISCGSGSMLGEMTISFFFICAIGWSHPFILLENLICETNYFSLNWGTIFFRVFLISRTSRGKKIRGI